MNALDSRIRELVAYARERDGEDRTALFRNLVDLFLTSKAPSREPTRSQLLDVIEALIPHVEAESRRTAADLVARMSTPPLDLGLRLARDRASLVSELLKNMPFDEDAFIDLIRMTGREHHQILASRADLSANVWIALARAAPAAPPFDSRSTLALWRDDLGAHDAVSAEETWARPAATVTLLHPDSDTAAQPVSPDTGTQKAASLRILRSGEDLLADRAAKTPGLAENSAVTAANDSDDTGDEQDGSAAPAARTADHMAMDESAAVRDRLRDPGPGGWSWRSDRDGIVTDVSPHGRKLLAGLPMVVGASMLDLLGLNTKLGHPVSRAFQRRSAIHDAPISLDDLTRGHRHWTLDAAPIFSPCGGVFEGYEGTLTPVVAARDSGELPEFAVDDEPMFLDDLAPAPAAVADSVTFTPASDSYPQSFSDHASVLASEAPTIRTGLPEAKAPAAPKASATAKPGMADMLGDAMRSAVSGIVAESLASAMPASGTPTNATAAQETAAATPERLDVPPHQAEILGTLDLLEEALSRLGEGSRKTGNMQLRLQAEIAAACARTLREQLGD